VSQVCRTCHAGNGTAFDGSGHKQAFEEHGWPECEQCHGKHDIAPTDDDMLGTAPGDLCHDCHVEYAGNAQDDCIATADHFRTTIRKLAEGSEQFDHETERLAERGLDVEPLENAAGTLHDALRGSRSAIHSFDRSDFDNVASAGLDALETGQASIEAANEEHRFRRRGLMVSIGVLGFLALVLWLKIREIDRSQNAG
jgi:hypothetical protein